MSPLHAVTLVALLLGARSGESRAPLSTSASQPDTPATAEADENVRVTVFRRLIEKSRASNPGSNGPYCLAVGAGDEGRPKRLDDPRPGVLERLQQPGGATVRAFSQCRSGDVLFDTAGIQWRRADEARVNAGFLGWVGQEKDAAHVWYTVRLDPGGWTVTGERVQPY
jgi:hypothetical protein